MQELVSININSCDLQRLGIEYLYSIMLVWRWPFCIDDDKVARVWLLQSDLHLVRQGLAGRLTG